MPNAATTSQTMSPSTGLLTSSVSVYGATTNYVYAFSPTIITATTNSHWAKDYKDGFGRDLAVEAGYGTTIVSHTATQYGPLRVFAFGKATYVSLPYAIASGVVTASDGTSNIGWNAYVYDGVGRTLKQTAPDTSATNYLYIGNTVKVTDPAGNWKRYTSDVLGNLIKVEEPNPAFMQSDNTATNFVTNYTYDLEGHLTQVQMPRPYGGGSYTQTRTFNYNLATGKLTSAVNPENGTVNYGYYADGLLQSKIDAKGQKVLYSHDGYGRLAYIDRFPDGVMWDYCHSVALAYDSGQNGSNAVGRLGGATTGLNGYCSNTVYEYFGYTPGGLMTSKGAGESFPMSYADNGYVIYESYGYGPESLYTYDNEGHMTSYGSQGFSTFTYSLDSMGRPTGLTESGTGTTWVQNVAYGPAGETQTIQYRTSGGNYFNENGRITIALS